MNKNENILKLSSNIKIKLEKKHINVDKKIKNTKNLNKVVEYAIEKQNLQLYLEYIKKLINVAGKRYTNKFLR